MLESADVTIMNFKFEGATSDEEGSILENYGKLTVSNVTFRDNVAEQGNLIFNASGATLNVEGSTFENNEAQLSALIYNLGSANINGGATFTGDYGLLSPVYSKGILTVEETVFTSTSGENGGAIHNDGGTVVIARSEFKTTSADNHGGAIYNVGDADLSVYDTTFDGTISTLDGGAIFNGEGAKLVTEASIFKNIDITGVGGAIFNAGAFEDKDSLFENNSANAGAAIYTLGSVSLDGSTFKTNSAQEGGAIYAGQIPICKLSEASFQQRRDERRGYLRVWTIVCVELALREKHGDEPRRRDLRRLDDHVCQRDDRRQQRRTAGSTTPEPRRLTTRLSLEILRRVLVTTSIRKKRDDHVRSCSETSRNMVRRALTRSPRIVRSLAQPRIQRRLHPERDLGGYQRRFERS